MTFILNLTQHSATAEQLVYGVRDLTGEDLATLKRLLTFNDLPTKAEIRERAEKITQLAKAAGAGTVMIGGADYLLPELTIQLKAAGCLVLHAFTKR